MNISTPLGLIFGISIILFTIVGEIQNYRIFFNLHSLLIVIGGTVSTALICFNSRQIKEIGFVLLKQFSGKRTKQRIEAINEIIKLSVMVKNGSSLESELVNINIPFLREGLDLYLEGSMSKDDLFEVLEKRIEVQNERYVREGLTFKTIGKFPPAFGLIGATLGMIGLLQNLGKDNAFDNLGPAMSVALTATFWGLVLTNLILLPLGENLSLAADEDLIIREIVVEGVILLRDKKHPLLVREYLSSYLSPDERGMINEVK